MASSFPSTAKAVFWRDDFLRDARPFHRGRAHRSGGAAVHLYFVVLRVHILSPPSIRCFTRFPSTFPKTLVLSWICLQTRICMKAQLLLVSGFVVFCCKGVNSSKAHTAAIPQHDLRLQTLTQPWVTHTGVSHIHRGFFPGFGRATVW